MNQFINILPVSEKPFINHKTATPFLIARLFSNYDNYASRSLEVAFLLLSSSFGASIGLKLLSA